MVAIRDRLVNLLASCHDDIDLFNSAVLGSPPFWWRQREMCRSIEQYRITCVYSGNAIGKDYLVGRLPPWWLYTRADSLCIVTGPTQTQIGSISWKEIRRAHMGSRIPLGATMTNGVKTSPQVYAVRAGRGWQALGYSTTNVERASGQHNRKLLVIAEEASGIEDEIWDAIDSLKYAKLVAIGNPTRAEGRFVDLIHQAEKDRRDGIPRHKAVNAIRIPSTDSPHAGLDESPYGLADKTWLDDAARRYGRESLWYRTHVLAEIPRVSADTLIPEAWLDYATSIRRDPVAPNHPIHLTRRIAVDLGEGVGRDSSSLLVRDDWGILEVVCGAQLGLAEAAYRMWDLGRKWGIAPGMMSYDRMGIGRDFPFHLARLGLEGAAGYAGEASPQSRDFTNLRSEAAWKLRQRLDPGFAPGRQPFAIPPGPWYARLRAELKPLTYDLAGRQTRLLKKVDWMTILGHSPDVADSLIQSFSGIN